MDEPKKQKENNIIQPFDSKDSLPSTNNNENIKENTRESQKDDNNSNNNIQDFEIEIERDNNQKKKFLSINRRNPYNYSKSPNHTNNHIKNKMYNMVKLSKPFLTSKHIFLNKYSLKEVNECIYKDYNQIANILPYYQNYYYQNKINNYKNSNYANTNNNDSILICLKYIEYSNFFFNSDISYKIQNLLFNIIIGDKGILNQNKYTFLKNKLNEVYNKLIPYQIRHNYLKSFYERNPEESLYYLFKRDLDKINNSKPINYKKLNYLKEIYEIVKQKMGTKKEYINSYINKLLSNKNGGNYNNNLLVHNNSYSDRKQSFNQYSSNNNNISSFNYHNNNFITNEEMNLNLYNNNTNGNKEHNFKGSYPTKHNSNNYFYKNRNNSYFKQDLIEIKDPKTKLLNDEDENNNDEYINLMAHNNNINSANNGNSLWNNNMKVNNNMNNINNININSFQGFNGNLMTPNNNINLNSINPIQMNINNINMNRNIIKNNNLFLQQNNNMNNQMKINLPNKNTNVQNNINEGNNENININLNNINGPNDINNNIENNDINNKDFLYNSEDNNKNKKKLNSDNTLPRINFNDNTSINDTNIIDINNKNISKNDSDLNILLKQMISANILFISNINKYISQYAQLNQSLELYKSSIIEIYNQGIINNISFSNQSYHNNKNNNNNNYNHNINNINKINISKQEKLIETDYEKLGKLKNEKPEKISENLKLFENYIILPIYNQINYNNNTPETVQLYSKVYQKYKEVINTIIKENNLEGTIVEPYGSIVNNFLTSDGDIDISIVPNNISKIGFKIYLEQIEKELIKRELIEDNNEINDININNNSRIYISTRYTLLTVTDLETNINIDITVHNLLPIKNTEMIRLYSLFDQRFHILGIFLKHWVKINHIKGSRNEFLSSYALLLLIIHFLQDIVEPKVLPMLQEIISEDKNKKDYDYKYCYDDKEFETNLYYEKNFDSMKEYMKTINCGKENDLSVSELLVQFFEYYGYIYNNINFNSKHYLISIKHSNKDFVANNTEHIAFPLEDPFDVNHNPSSSLKLNTPQYSDFIFCMRKEINNILSGQYFK